MKAENEKTEITVDAALQEIAELKEQLAAMKDAKEVYGRWYDQELKEKDALQAKINALKQFALIL